MITVYCALAPRTKIEVAVTLPSVFGVPWTKMRVPEVRPPDGIEVRRETRALDGTVTETGCPVGTAIVSVPFVGGAVTRPPIIIRSEPFCQRPPRLLGADAETVAGAASTERAVRLPSAALAAITRTMSPG